jgi:predicted signal transduction protein with EAL and GGDEF domain
VYPESGEDTETLLRNADAAMYHIKGLGKNNFDFFSPELNPLAHRQLELADQFDTFSNRVVGAEALIRWPRRLFSLHRRLISV